MEEIKIAFVELQAQHHYSELAFLKKHRLRKRIKKAVSLTECHERTCMSEDYPVLVLPFMETELTDLSASETAMLLNKIYECSLVDYFFYQPDLYQKTREELLSFLWVNEKVFTYIQKRRLIELCSKRLNVRQSQLGVLLLESGLRPKKKGRITANRSSVIITKWILRTLYTQVNRISILTSWPEEYEELIEQIYEDNGLIVSVAEQIPKGIHVLIDTSEQERITACRIPRTCAYISFFVKQGKAGVMLAQP